MVVVGMCESDTDRCPGCGEETRFYLNCAPGTFFCESCELEFWQEGDGWYCCDTDGEPRRVAVTDGGSERNGADWVREGVVKKARETGQIAGSGAWLARPVEGFDRIDVFRFDHSVDTGTEQSEAGQ